jgi:hypothetical protein
MAQHPFILILSAVARHSWSALMNPAAAQGLFGWVSQERFALDTCAAVSNRSQLTGRAVRSRVATGPDRGLK